MPIQEPSEQLKRILSKRELSSDALLFEWRERCRADDGARQGCPPRDQICLIAEGEEDTCDHAVREHIRRCKSCRNEIEDLKKGFTPRPIRPAVLAAALLAVALCAFQLVHEWNDEARFDSAITSANPVIMRFVGSNTIGIPLIPKMVEEFLLKDGARRVREKAIGSAGEKVIQAKFPGSDAINVVTISAHGSEHAVHGLVAREADVGMSSRPIKESELENAKRAGIGDLSSPAQQHVIGFDVIAILVNKSNPVKTLSRDQIAGIFSGKITNWHEVGGDSGPITLYARNSDSGTFNVFEERILVDRSLSKDSKLFDDSTALSNAVASDPSAIGFAGNAFIRESKKIEVADDISPRKLFLFTPIVARNPFITRFIKFAESVDGKKVVVGTGFAENDLGKGYAVRSCLIGMTGEH